MNRHYVLAAAFALVVGAPSARGSGFGGAPLPGPGRGFSNLDSHVDLGLEAGTLGRVGSSERDGAASIGLYILAAVDEMKPWRPTPRWHFLSRVKFEFHLGVVVPFASDAASQLHMSAGSGIGPLGVGLAMVVDDDVALGVELRLRHRFGPRRASPSVGVLVRGEYYVAERADGPHRITFGLHGAFDIAGMFGG